MRKFWIFVFACLVLSSAAFAQDELIINADNLSYDRENKLVRAKGSVEVIYKDVVVYGDDITYNQSSEVVAARNGFVLLYEGLTIEGDALEYEVKNKVGEARDFRFTYKNIELDGERIDFTREKYLLMNSSFSTCDLSDPHYRVTARDITLYPEYGWLVAYWGFFWLNNVPVVPVPTYIYDVFAEQRGGRNLPPFPSVDSNNQDGVVITERLAWHLRREFSGTYSLIYATKKGIGGGAEANYIVNDTSRGNMRLYGNVTDGLWGGVTHRLYLGEEIEGTPEMPFAFFAQPVYREYELITNLTYRERINYQRISFLPDIALKKNRAPFFRDDLKYELNFSAGKVEEEANISLGRGTGLAKLYWEWPEIWLGEITPNLSYDARFYSNGNRWIQTLGGIELRRSLFNYIAFSLGYLRYLSVDGTSPFMYEIYRFSSLDRLTSSWYFLIGETGVGVSTSHFVDNWTAEDIDYALFFKLHCYNLVMNYRSLRQEFNLGVSLAGN
jgi:lipopolysaccharide export system protein LptA